MKTYFLYAGQGSQKAGMGKDLYEEFPKYREVIDSLELDFDIKELMHNGELSELSKTEYTQPCMASFAAGVTEILKENGIVPDGACGLSLGEYGALYAANVWSVDTYVNLTAFRGRAMQNAAEGIECSMSAILGAESDLVLEACKENEQYGFVTLANYNCPGQYVICGDETAVAKTEDWLMAKGVKRCVRLNVSGPFHTKYMQPAGEQLRGYFDKITFNKPKIPVVMNVTGDFYNDSEDLKDLLIRQVQSSVHFEEDLRKLLATGECRFIEIGPGKALSGFLKKTAKAMNCPCEVTSIETAEDLKKLIEEERGKN
jgi:[acyl-carrier-protein] S-malonyltransferase